MDHLSRGRVLSLDPAHVLRIEMGYAFLPLRSFTASFTSITYCRGLKGCSVGEILACQSKELQRSGECGKCCFGLASGCRLRSTWDFARANLYCTKILMSRSCAELSWEALHGHHNLTAAIHTASLLLHMRFQLPASWIPVFAIWLL